MKLTKRTYTAARAALESKLAYILIELEALSERYDGVKASDDIYTLWNNLHDASDDTGDEIHDLDRAYSRRNWTSQDWYQYELVAMNID